MKTYKKTIITKNMMGIVGRDTYEVRNDNLGLRIRHTHYIKFDNKWCGREIYDYNNYNNKTYNELVEEVNAIIQREASYKNYKSVEIL